MVLSVVHNMLRGYWADLKRRKSLAPEDDGRSKRRGLI